MVALDAKTGKKVWSVVNGDPSKGQTSTAAPVVIKDKATGKAQSIQITAASGWSKEEIDRLINELDRSSNRMAFSIVIAALGSTLVDGPELEALAAAYVLLLAVIGPVTARYADRLPLPRLQKRPVMSSRHGCFFYRKSLQVKRTTEQQKLPPKQEWMPSE